MAAVAVAAIVLGTPGVPAAAATTLRVDAGYAGAYVPGQPLPVRVRVTADRLLAGTLEVSTGGAPTSVGVEVPGGSEKEFLVLVSTSPVGEGLNVTARLPDGSDTVASGTGTVTPMADAEVVGVLPGALAGRPLPGPTTLAVDAGTARFVALGPAELDRAPESLMALRTIAVGADEVARQAPAVRNGLLRWVETGGRLLVDATPGSEPVAGLPDGWQPGAADRARAGQGEVRLTAGAMAAGRWAGLVEPTARLADERGRRVGGPPLGDALASDAGFRVPELSWLVGFLALYVVVVGPGMYVLLRRRGRPELAWAVIPVVAVLFAGAAWVGGRGLRTDTESVHGTVIATGAHGSTAQTWLGFSSRGGAELELGYPDRWVVGTAGRDFPQLSTLRRVEVTPSGPRALLPLNAGQFGLASARGPSGEPGALVVEAGAEADGRAAGTVRNDTGLALDGVGILLGSNAVGLGSLGPGESRDWSLVAGRWQGGPPVEFELWEPDQVGLGGETSFSRFSLFYAAQQAGMVDLQGSDVVAVGWTEGYRPPVRASGRTERPQGRTLVVGTAPVHPAGARHADVSIRRETVRTTGGLGSVFRFSVDTTGRAVDPAKLSLRSAFFPLEVWTGEAWTPVKCDDPRCPALQFASGPGQFLDVRPACPPGMPCPPAALRGPIGPDAPVVDVALPDGAVRNGVVYVRADSGIPPFLGDAGVALREAA
ncbi:MAG: hypothetical protein ACLGI2_03035 [Acidimicrobiia bacterium]